MACYRHRWNPRRERRRYWMGHEVIEQPCRNPNCGAFRWRLIGSRIWHTEE